MTKTEKIQKLGMFLLLWLTICVCSGTEALAQRGGFSPDRIFEFMDTDKNGRLDASEIEASRGPFKEMLQGAGIDYRRGFDMKSFTAAFEKIRVQREAGGGGPAGGPPMRGDDRSRTDSRGRTDDRGRSDESGRSGDRGRSDDADRRRQEEERRRAEEARRSPAKTAPVIRPKDRVTVDLPATFTEGDTDGDGQIGFYEWKKWKRDSINDFAGYDHNGDGFLTPKELLKGPSAPLTSSIASTSAGGGGTGVVATPSTLSGEAVLGAMTGSSRGAYGAQGSTSQSVTSSSSTAGPTSTSSVDTNSVAGRRAESMFRLLDQDRNDSIAGEEWSRARTIRPLFEQGGVDLSKPMSKNEFLNNYVRLSGS